MTIVYILLAVLIILIITLLYQLINSNNITQQEFQKQLESKYDEVIKEITNYEKAMSDALLKEWQTDNEFNIRASAIASNSVRIANEISSETSIFNGNFNFNPKDIKFVGRFIDLIVFDGSAEENDVSIYFIEVNRKNKKDNSIFKSRVRKAIENKSFNWQEINI